MWGYRLKKYTNIKKKRASKRQKKRLKGLDLERKNSPQELATPGYDRMSRISSPGGSPKKQEKHPPDRAKENRMGGKEKVMALTTQKACPVVYYIQKKRV